MKKITVMLMLALVLSGLSSGINCLAMTAATVSGETLEAATGTTFEYRVSISGNPGLTGLGLRLNFDTSVFSIVYDDEEIDCTQGDFTQSGMLVCGATSGGCQILWTHSSDIASDGTVFVLKLRVNEDATPGKYVIGLQNNAQNTVNKAEELVPLACNSGTVTVREFQPLIYGMEISAKQGERFDYAVMVQDNPSIAACDVVVRFDPEVLILEPDAASGDYAVKGEGGVTQGSLVSKPYSDAVEVFWNHAYGSTAEGTLFILHFKVKDFAAVGEHVIEIACVAENTENVEEEPVAFAVNNGKVSVASALVVDVKIEDSHTAAVSIQHTPAKYAATAFYNEDGRFLAVDMRTLDEQDAAYTIVNESLDFEKTTYKLMLLDANYCPLCDYSNCSDTGKV